MGAGLEARGITGMKRSSLRARRREILTDAERIGSGDTVGASLFVTTAGTGAVASGCIVWRGRVVLGTTDAAERRPYLLFALPCPSTALSA